MPDPSDIRQALLVKLNGDATLLTYMPNGAHWNEAPAGSRRHIIVSLVAPSHARSFSGRSHHDNLYMVKAVALSTETNATANTKNAAARILTILDGGTLTITGFTLMTMMLDPDLDVIDYLEVDDVDPGVRWIHRGGHYRVVASTS